MATLTAEHHLAPAGTGVDHFAWWSERHCVQSVDRFAGEPLRLEAWQLEFMAEALAVDEDGAPFWRSVVLVVPRKQGKTTMLAAYATYHLLEDEGSPEVLLAASSDKQAGRLFDGVCAFARRSEYIRERVHLREYIGEIARVDGQGKLLRMASDPNRAHGWNPSRVVIDELHAWTTPSLRRAWSAFTTAGGARANTQVLVISTAGEAHERETSILGRLIDANESQGEVERRGALTISRNREGGVLVYNYAAPVGKAGARAARHNFGAIRAANPASWVSDEYLRRQAANPELSDAEFLQLHGCVWAESDETFVSLDAWDALADGEPVEDGRAAFVGLDGSFNHDTTVAAWASRSDDGRIDVDCHIWSVRLEAPHHEFCAGGTIDYQRVEDFVVRDCFERLRVEEATYDPRFLGRSAQVIADRLGDARIAPVEPQSRHMRDALAAFHRGVSEGTLRHRGDPKVRAHLAATKARRDERGWVVEKRRSPRPIDAVIAIALAYWRASREEEHYSWRPL